MVSTRKIQTQVEAANLYLQPTNGVSRIISEGRWARNESWLQNDASWLFLIVALTRAVIAHEVARSDCWSQWRRVLVTLFLFRAWVILLQGTWYEQGFSYIKLWYFIRWRCAFKKRAIGARMSRQWEWGSECLCVHSLWNRLWPFPGSHCSPPLANTNTWDSELKLGRRRTTTPHPLTPSHSASRDCRHSR